MALVASLFVIIPLLRSLLNRSHRLLPITWPLWPRCLSTFDLYDSSDFSTFGFGLLMALVAFSAFHPMIYMTPSETHPSALATSTAVVSSTARQPSAYTT